MKRSMIFRSLRLPRMAMPILLSVCCLPSAFAAQAEGAEEGRSVAHRDWLIAMAQNTGSAEGCFHASFPSVSWEAVECKVAHPRVHPVHAKPLNGAAEVTGNGKDFVAKAAGLITKTLGSFPKVSGVTSEKSVGVAAFGDGGILGPNEYTLQINSNFNSTTAACKSHSGCTVWQQFIYSPDYNTDGEAAVFMQYWLIGWGSSACPSGFGSDGGGDCYKNSSYVSAPDMPITALSKLTLSGAAVAGGNDTVVFDNGTDAYSITGKDSVVDLATVWNESEFNIVGNAGGSRADFNKGSSVTVKAALSDGSTAAPTCVANAGTTGETNNLTLGKCTTSSGPSPDIEFTETD